MVLGIMMKTMIFAILSLLAAGTLHAGDCKCEADSDKKAPEAVKGIKCPVDETNGCKGSYCHEKDNPRQTSEYEGRTVFFCCSGCVERFEKDPKPFLEMVKAQWKLIDSAKK